MMAVAERTGTTTSVYFRPDVLLALAARCQDRNSRSEVVNRDLLRLYSIYQCELAEIKFSAGEVNLLVDALNGCNFGHPGAALTLWAGVADAIRLDHLDRKWSVDGEALVQRLRRMSISQCLAVIDAVERYWEAVGKGLDARPEDYLPETDVPNTVVPDEIIYDRWYGEVTRYVIGRAGAAWFFLWSSDGDPLEMVPADDGGTADTGIRWHSSLEDAARDAREAFEAHQQTSDDPLWQELIDALPQRQGE